MGILIENFHLSTTTILLYYTDIAFTVLFYFLSSGAISYYRCRILLFKIEYYDIELLRPLRKIVIHKLVPIYVVQNIPIIILYYLYDRVSNNYINIGFT